MKKFYETFSTFEAIPEYTEEKTDGSIASLQSNRRAVRLIASVQ